MEELKWKWKNKSLQQTAVWNDFDSKVQQMSLSETELTWNQPALGRYDELIWALTSDNLYVCTYCMHV